MKKLIIGLTLFSSISAFADYDMKWCRIDIMRYTDMSFDFVSKYCSETRAAYATKWCLIDISDRFEKNEDNIAKIANFCKETRGRYDNKWCVIDTSYYSTNTSLENILDICK